MIGSDPDFFLECMLGGFGSKGLSVFNRAALRAYKDAFRNPETIRAGCEDYRAALTIDMQHDIADAGKKKAITEFLTWMIGDGQKDCAALSFAPLPKAVVDKEKKQIASIQ